MDAQAVEGKTEQLVKLLRSRERLLVLTHTNPDPDSIGSAVGLRHLANERLEMASEFGLVGRVMRAENKAMIDSLGIDLTPLSQIELESFDCIALVDTQPGFGHTSLPEGRVADIILDHHVPPEQADVPTAAFEDVRTEVGATSSIVTSYLMALDSKLTKEVATALFYGIRTDTADLSRNVSSLDVAAYEYLVPKIDRQVLAQITTPDLPLRYYKALRDALNNIRIFDSVVLCSLGKISGPEMVAEVADLLVRLEGKQAVFCGGTVDQTYYVSVRSELNGRSAWHLLRGALDGEGTFGGHGAVAGGSVPLPDNTTRTVKRLERRLERNVLRTMDVEGTTVGGLAES